MSDNHLTPLRAHHAGPLGQKDREIGTVATEGPSKTVSTDAHYNISHPKLPNRCWCYHYTILNLG